MEDRALLLLPEAITSLKQPSIQNTIFSQWKPYHIRASRKRGRPLLGWWFYNFSSFLTSYWRPFDALRFAVCTTLLRAYEELLTITLNYSYSFVSWLEKLHVRNTIYYQKVNVSGPLWKRFLKFVSVWSKGGGVVRALASHQGCNDSYSLRFNSVSIIVFRFRWFRFYYVNVP